MEPINESTECSEEPIDCIRDDDDNDNDDDDDDELSDEDAGLKNIRHSEFRSLRRNDSFESFLTRSERVALLGKDPPPPLEELKKRKVQFVSMDSSELETVFEVETFPPEVKDRMYMCNTDFDRIETEVRMTSFRWENREQIPFDDNQNSMRGLEHIDHSAQRKKDLERYKHNCAVMQEINRQKQDCGSVQDWEAVRKISQRFTVHSMNQAVEIGRADRDAFHRAWDDNPVSSTLSSHSSEEKKKESKKKKKLFFWQK